eukprot:12302223-Alexandrium_andersonii.AAC.1
MFRQEGMSSSQQRIERFFEKYGEWIRAGPFSPPDPLPPIMPLELRRVIAGARRKAAGLDGWGATE